MATDLRGWEPQPPIHEVQEGTQNLPGGRAELWKGQDKQCCQPRWQLGPPHPWLGTSSFLQPGTRSRIQGKQLQSPPQQGLIFHLPPPGSTGAFPAPKIPPNSLPDAESSSTRGGLENTQGFGKGWEQTPPSSSHWRARIWRDTGLGGLSTPWRGAGGDWGGQRDPLPRQRDMARGNLLQPGVKSCHWMGAKSSVLATAFPISSQEPPRPSWGAGAPQKTALTPALAFHFKCPRVTTTVPVSCPRGWGQSQEAVLLLLLLPGNSSPRIKG